MKHVCLAGLASLICLIAVRANQSGNSKATVAYVRKLQTNSGGFALKQSDSGSVLKPSLRATVTAVRAVRYFGGAVPNMDACVSFVDRCFDKASGGFADVPGGTPDVMVTAIGLMGVVDLKMPISTYQAGALKYLADHCKTFEEIRLAAAAVEAVKERPACAGAWLRQIEQLRNADGTFGNGSGQARETGGAVAAILRLGGKLEHADRLVEAMRAGQRPSGGFGTATAKEADLATTYRVMRSFHMLQQLPARVDALKSFLGTCHNADGGYGVAPGEPSTVSGVYYAGIIRHWLR